MNRARSVTRTPFLGPSPTRCKRLRRHFLVTIKSPNSCSTLNLQLRKDERSDARERPSAHERSRTHVRAPRVSNGKSASPLSNLNFAALPTQHELQFQTPATNNRPWDVSPLASSPLALPAALPVDVDEEEDHSEIEYMPSKLQVEETWVPRRLTLICPTTARWGRD